MINPRGSCVDPRNHQVRSFVEQIDRSPCYRTEGKHLLRISNMCSVCRTILNARFRVHYLRTVRVVFNGDGVLGGKRHAIHVDGEEKGSCPIIISTSCPWLRSRIVKLKHAGETIARSVERRFEVKTGLSFSYFQI